MTDLTVAHLFRRDRDSLDAHDARIGAEIEFLALDAATHKPARLAGPLGEWLRHAAKAGGWEPLHSSKGAPKYEIANAGTLTLEPGAQVEFSSRPLTDVVELIAMVQRVGGELVTSARAHDIELITVGIDPFNAIENAPLQLDAARYRAMDAFFSAVSPSGLRMMRQTAALQVSIDPVLDSQEDPFRTWRVLNRAAPLLTAMFANSAYYAGAATGCASYRAKTWMELDPTRTGLFAGDDALNEYATFASNARVIADAPHYRRFRDIEDMTDRDAAWEDHLTTLFPEVRPKKYYEIRCIDSIPLQHVSVAIAVVASLTWNDATMTAVEQIAPLPDHAVWERAARLGMADAELAAGARVLANHARTAYPQYAQLMDEWMNHSRREVRLSRTTSSATII